MTVHLPSPKLDTKGKALYYLLVSILHLLLVFLSLASTVHLPSPK